MPLPSPPPPSFREHLGRLRLLVTRANLRTADTVRVACEVLAPHHGALPAKGCRRRGASRRGTGAGREEGAERGQKLGEGCRRKAESLGRGKVENGRGTAAAAAGWEGWACGGRGCEGGFGSSGRMERRSG
jgi:hypothetical protein